jgi:hypothetical protein
LWIWNFDELIYPEASKKMIVLSTRLYFVYDAYTII